MNKVHRAVYRINNPSRIIFEVLDLTVTTFSALFSNKFMILKLGFESITYQFFNGYVCFS